MSSGIKRNVIVIFECRKYCHLVKYLYKEQHKPACETSRTFNLGIINGSKEKKKVIVILFLSPKRIYGRPYYRKYKAFIPPILINMPPYNIDLIWMQPKCI